MEEKAKYGKKEAYTPRVQSVAEKKVRALTHLYYSRKDVQKAMFQFAKNREVSPRFYQGFGKRPDVFYYPGDIYSLTQKGATSFHCSEEIWTDPMKIKTGMSREDANKIRSGWDFLIDIDCEHGIDYSAMVAKAIIKALKKDGIKNLGIKFSGSKGFHILVPWKAFPKEINGEKLTELFPRLPRTLMAYMSHNASEEIKKMLPSNFAEKFKKIVKVKQKCLTCKGPAENYRLVRFVCKDCGLKEELRIKVGRKSKKGQLPICKGCNKEMPIVLSKGYEICTKCGTNSIKDPKGFAPEMTGLIEWMGLDALLISPRHLFRMPYSLHEKSGLASVVIEEKDLDEFIKNPDFKEKIANPLSIKIKDFMPESEENEATEFVMQALAWADETGYNKEIDKRSDGKYADFKELSLTEIQETQFPPCVKKILKGLKDGKKRGLFILINLFRSIGMDKEEMEKKIYAWNEKNEEPLRKGYISSQLTWTYNRKPIMPQNCKDFYRDLGVCSPDATCAKIKNPVNYVVRKNFMDNRNKSPEAETSSVKEKTDELSKEK